MNEGADSGASGVPERRRPRRHFRFTLGVLLIGFKLLEGDAARAVDWNPERPRHYRVVEGDTLWSIAGRFLRHPWEWPEVWRGNAGIGDPDRIYPGDLIVLDDSRTPPVLRLGGMAEERLSPRVRVTPLVPPVPRIPLRAIGPFLTRPQVIESDALERMPYVVGLAEEHVMGGAGDRLYVRSLAPSMIRDYSVIRPGRAYEDPESRALLGHEAVHVGEAYLEADGDPATLVLTQAEREARAGDRLMPAPRVLVGADFRPRPARAGLEGRIIGVLDGVTQIGQYSVVALNRGRADRCEVGDVFEIWQKGSEIRDTLSGRFGEKVTGPEWRAGLLMVFLAYERVSFALVMNAERFIHVQDVVRAP